MAAEANFGGALADTTVTTSYRGRALWRSNPSERGGLDYRILNLEFVLSGFARRQLYRRPNPLLIRCSSALSI